MLFQPSIVTVLWSVIDAQTAQAAALDFVGVLHGTTTREELLAYPHIAIIDDLGTIRVK